jgi:hypothetical protein
MNRNHSLLNWVGLCALVVILFGLVRISGAGNDNAVMDMARSSHSNSGLELTLLHTNDTWGYLNRCG